MKLLNPSNRSMRLLCTVLAILMLMGGLTACAGSSEVPEGFQRATCSGEYFRLYVPTQWTVNTESGISGAFIPSNPGMIVTMTEVPFEVPEGQDPLTAFVNAHVAEVSQLKGYERKKFFEKSNLVGFAAADMTYVITETGNPQYFRQVLTYVGKRFYIFTYSAPEAHFETLLDVVDSILEEIVFESYPYEGEHERKIPGNVEAPEGMKLVSDNEVAYRFFAPENWIRDEKNGQNVVYFSEEDRSNVSMLGYEPQDYSNYTVEQYWKDFEVQSSAMLDNFKLIKVTDTTLDGGEKPAKVYEYTYTLGGVTYKVRQTICMVGMIYTFTYTALPENYDAHMEDVLAMEQALYFRKFGG